MTDKNEDIEMKSSGGPKRATLASMKKKKRAESEFSIFVRDGSETIELTLLYRAIGARRYDELVSQHPPKAADRLEGATFDLDTFAPALIAEVCVEPRMSVEDTIELWSSDDWSRGDLMVLFRNAVELNNRGIDVPFSARG